MRIMWVNSGMGKTFSNTRLFGVPPVLQKLGHESLVLLAGRAPGTRLPEYFLPLPMPFGKLGLYRILLTLLLPFLCLRFRPQIVLSDWMSARQTRLAVLLRRLGLLHCKFVHDVRTVPVKEDGGKSWKVYAGSLTFARRHFDGLTTITEPLREEICRHFQIPKEKIAVWTSGVDVQHFRPQEANELRHSLELDDKFVVFYHGSVHENRGVVELAQALNYLRDIDNLRLLIMGGGNQWKRLEKVVREEGLNHVILHPGVPYEQIPRWIACADLCVVPLPDHAWWRVSSPLKLMEYLAMGKAVLLTEMQAHRAVISADDDAFYVPRCNSQDFAGGLRQALAQRSRFAQMGQRGRSQAISQLTWDHQAHILLDYLQQVANGEINLQKSEG